MLTASLAPTSNVPLIGENGHLRSRSTSQHFQGDRARSGCRQPGISTPSVDTLSDSLSLATTATEGTIGEVWERKQYPDMPLGCAIIKNQPPSFLNLPNRVEEQSSEKDLYEFLKDAELEHYYTVLTRHLKIRSVQQIKYVEDSDLAEMGFSRPEQRRLRKHFKRECPQTAMGKLRKRLARSTSGRCSSPRFKDTLDGLSSRNVNVLSISLDSTPTSEDGDSKRRTLLFTQGSKSEDLNKCLTDDLSSLTIDGGTNYRIIRSSELEIGSSLGEGEFGKVFQGVWHTDARRVVQVAIKIMDIKQIGDDTCDFLNEIATMHRLNHPDIVRLLGVCIEVNTIKIVTELAPLRSLLECLRETELRSSFSVPVLHKFSIQIARGMSYLEECGLVHRDLAARNILVFSKDSVKISDFGMSRALQLGKSYYQSNFNVNLKLPIAWCAPECIHDLLFTTASDMWAYGITLWEIFTYGFTPWAGLTGRQILEMIDAPKFGRLDQPETCPDPIYDAVMRACWAHEPKARPTFNQLLGMLPRLSPEVWITTSEYRPDSDPNMDTISTTEEFPYNPGFRPHGTRSLGRPLFIRANETVCVLGKRSSTTWKVVNLRTGLVGCIPSSILKPYTCEKDSSFRDQTSATNNNNNNNTSGNSNTLGLVAKTRLRMSRRETVSRFSKLSVIIPSDGMNNNNNTSRSRGKITADQISLPQNDFRHIGHVGSDGRTFGELGLVGKIIDSKDDLSDTQSFYDLDVSEEKFKGDSKSSNKASTLQINPAYNNKNHPEVIKTIPLETESLSVKDLSSLQQQQHQAQVQPQNQGQKVKTLESPKKLFTTNKNYFTKSSQIGKGSHSNIQLQQQQQPEKEKPQTTDDNDETDKLFEDIKFDIISESNGFDLGSSLLDEVFKCFQMDKPTEKMMNNNETDENNKSELTSTIKEIAREHSSNPIQQLDSLNCLGNSYYGDEGGNNNNNSNNDVNETSGFSSTLSNNSTMVKSPVTPLKNIKSDLVETRRVVSKGYNAAKPLHTTTSSSPSSNSITRKILTNGSLTHHNNHHHHSVQATSNVNSNNKNDNTNNNAANIITPFISSPSDCINSLNYESADNELTNSIIHDSYMMNDVVDGEADGDGDVNHLKKLKSVQKTEHKSLWKRSSFGSLTRRSSSVSKTLQRNNFNGFNQSDHDENKRLVISRPVLLSRPNSITQTSLNKLPSNSSSSSIIGGLTEPSSLGSSTSRGSSLTVVSSSNGCSGGGGVGGCDSSNGGYASSVNNVQEELLAHSLNTDFDQGQQQQQQQPLSSASSCYYEISTNASLSPAPSLSSMTSVSGGLPHSLTSSIISTTTNTNNSSTTANTTYLLPNSSITSTAQGCLRALRSGDTVFRASTNISSGTLNSRRKISTLSRTSVTMMTDERFSNSRIQNLSPSATLVNLSAKNVCDTGVLSSSPPSSSSSSLLRNKSKLLFNRDIYQPSSQMSPSHSAFSAVTNPLQHKDLTRTHGSHLSSSSSSSISSPTTTSTTTTPFAYDSNGQYSQKNNNQTKSNHTTLSQPSAAPRSPLTTRTIKDGENSDNRSSMDLDCVVASFLGKDFADFLNKDINISDSSSSSSSSTSSKVQMSKTRTGLDAQTNLYRSPFKSSLSRLPRGGSQRDNNDNGDNGDVLAI